MTMPKYLVRHTWGDNKEHVIWLAALIRQTFPEATDDEVNCRTVVKSAWCNGFPVAHFGLARKDNGDYHSFEPTEEQKQGWTVLDERPLPDMQLS
jgi:hypothetical protein